LDKLSGFAHSAYVGCDFTSDKIAEENEWRAEYAKHRRWQKNETGA
jgi:hypothetical protein